VQALRIPKGRMAVLECQQGLLWLTQQDLLNDRFAEAGQRLHCPGPARLYLGAQGQAPALVRWLGPKLPALRLEEIRELASLRDYETFLREDGPWLGGFDLPFGQPRLLIEHEG
jgi:hypothetical protein